MDKISVLIIEDHKLFSETLVMMVNCDTRFEVTGRTDTEEALEYLRLKRTDIVLLDIHLGKVSGLDLIKSIQVLQPAVKVLVLSSSHQTAFVKGMMKEGAKGYLNKNVDLKELVKALETVNAGGNYICGEIKDQLAREMIEHLPSQKPF